MTRICRLWQKGYSVPSSIEAFNSGIVIPHHNYSYFTILYFFLAAHDNEIAVIYSDGVHAVPMHSKSKVFCPAV